MSDRYSDRPTRYVVTWPHPLAPNGEIASCINTCLLCRPDSGVEHGKLSRAVVGALADVSSRSADFAMAEEMMLLWGRVADELARRPLSREYRVDIPDEWRRRADQVYRDACKQEDSSETHENRKRDLVAALGIVEGSAQSTDWIAMLTRVARLAAEVARLGSLLPVCAQCGERPAECFGVYDGEPGDVPQAACGGCCGHGGEDGWCVAISDLADWANRRESRRAGRIADWLDGAASRGVVWDSATASMIAQAIRSGSWRDGSEPR